MRQKQGYTLRQVCGKPVIMATGKTSGQRKVFTLSESAAWLWQQASEQGDFTAATLAEALCNDYDITPEQARADVEELLALWLQEGIIAE